MPEQSSKDFSIANLKIKGRLIAGFGAICLVLDGIGGMKPNQVARSWRNGRLTR